jgi:hypothetical protein
MPQIVIDHLILDASAPERASQPFPNGVERNRFCGLNGLSFQVAPTSELPPAALARGDGVIGFAIGEDEFGRPASWALEFDADISKRNVVHVSAPNGADDA